MRYLLDTCTISDYVRRMPSVVEAIHAVPPSSLAMSTITEHELLSGVSRQPTPSPRLGEKVESLLRVITVLDFDRRDARMSALIRGALARSGATIGDFDNLIAGVAVARSLILVTSNTSEFERVPAIELENWR